MKSLSAHGGKIAFVVIVAMALVLLPWTTAPEFTLPAMLGSLQLTGDYSGEEAREIVNRMHDKSVSPDENLIGTYRSPEGEATLYISMYGEPSAAEKDFRKMILLIQPGSPVFRDFQQMSVAGKEVGFCRGLGQWHYFFARGNVLYWLAADEPVARMAILHLLESPSTFVR